MTDSNQYIDLYSGTEFQVLRIKNILEQEDFPSLIQNDLQSGNSGGFFGGTPSTIRLKVLKKDFEKAKTLIKD